MSNIGDQTPSINVAHVYLTSGSNKGWKRTILLLPPKREDVISLPRFIVEKSVKSRPHTLPPQYPRKAFLLLNRRWTVTCPPLPRQQHPVPDTAGTGGGTSPLVPPDTGMTDKVNKWVSQEWFFFVCPYGLALGWGLPQLAGRGQSHH